MISWSPEARGSPRSARLPSGAMTLILPWTGLTDSVNVSVTWFGASLTIVSAAGVLLTSAAWALAGAAGPTSPPISPRASANSTAQPRLGGVAGWRGAGFPRQSSRLKLTASSALPRLPRLLRPRRLLHQPPQQPALHHRDRMYRHPAGADYPLDDVDRTDHPGGE